MDEKIRDLFGRNVSIIEKADKAILYFRKQEFEKAFGYLSRITEEIKPVIATLTACPDIMSKECVNKFTSVLEELLDAAKIDDHVLLADLLEMKFVPCICEMQQEMAKKPELEVFSNEQFRLQCIQMAAKIKTDQSETAAAELFASDFSPEALLKSGYRVEFTSCGLMTLAVGTESGSIYLHTNNKVQNEAFLLAEAWSKINTDEYVVKGFGMGYHVLELAKLNPATLITVYECNEKILKLACAFTDLKWLFESENIKLIYDPGYLLFDDKISNAEDGVEVCIHAPSEKLVKI